MLKTYRVTSFIFVKGLRRYGDKSLVRYSGCSHKLESVGLGFQLRTG